jgi:hypothetical protein
MTITCPTCKATNSQGPQCRRCRTDLSKLFALMNLREEIIDRSRLALSEDEPSIAAAELSEAVALKSDPDVFKLLALSSLMQGDYEGAFNMYERATVDD